MAIPIQSYPFIAERFATGGNNLKAAATGLEDDESPYCVNMTMEHKGSISTRQGYVKLNRQPVATQPICLGMYEFDPSVGANTFISCWADGNIYTGVATLSAAILTGQDPAALYSFSTINDVCVMVNGTDTNVYYDGTNVFNLGMAAPLAAPALVGYTANPSGLPDGTYEYVVTYGNDLGAESNPSPALNVVKATAGTDYINLNTIPVSPDAQVTERNIYRTIAGGAIYYFVGTIADNTTTTFQDTVLDADLGEEVDFDNDVPRTFRYIATHKNRLFGIDAVERNRLYISKAYQPGQVPVLNFVEVEKGDGDIITGIVSFFDQLVIFKNKSIYVLSGNNEDDFAVQRTQSDSRVGCVAFRSIVVADNYVIFLSERGVYAFDGLRTIYISGNIEPVFDRTYSDQSVRFNWSQQQIACAANYKNGSRNWYVLAIPTSSSVYNRYIWIFDYVQKIWFPFDNINVDAMTIATESNEPRLYTARNGFMWRQDDTDSDGWVHNPAYSTTDVNTPTTLEDFTQVEINSTATAGGANTLTDTTIPPMTINDHVGKQLYIYGGTGAGQVRAVISNTADTFTVLAWGVIPDNTSQYTLGGWPVDALIDVPVKIIDGIGKGQNRVITTNTPYSFTIGVPWDTNPTTLSKYSIGYIECEWDSRWFHYNAPEYVKRLIYCHVNADREGDYGMDVIFRFDFFTGDINSVVKSLALTGADSVWDISLWDVDTWDQVSKTITRISNDANRIHRYVQVIFRKDAGNQPFIVNSFDLVYQIKGIRR